MVEKLVSELYHAGKLPKQSFNSLEEFFDSEHNEETLYILSNLTVKSKTAGGEYYSFVFCDDTGQIQVVALSEFTIVRTIFLGTAKSRNYQEDNWSDILKAKEGDMVDISCKKDGSVYLLHDLRNRSIEEKVEA